MPLSEIGVGKAALTTMKATKSFIDNASPSFKRKLTAKFAKFFTDFESYMSSTYDNISNVQLICSRAVNSAIDEIYVAPTFQTPVEGNKQLTDNELIDDIRQCKRVVVRGNGGSGKSIFMKMLWRSIFHEPQGKVPVFVELRKLNGFTDLDLRSLIRYTLSNGTDLSEELFNEMASGGYFIFVLDGFDEVSVDRRREIEREILDIEKSYKKCGFVVSSRPNDIYIGWTAFSILDVSPLQKSHCLEIVSKTPLNASVKNSFAKLITDSFFEKHEEFLSSPLLVLMMLATYKQKGSISDNLIDFYDNAFNALYAEHDATKESYKRPHCTTIIDFRTVFSTFCIFTYFNEQFEFNESLLCEYIDKAIEHVNCTRITKLDCNVEQFKYEILDAVNLLRKDGLTYVFIHRSFQEYFAAYWAMFIDNNRTEKVLEDFAARPYDQVLSLAYRMNPQKFDDNYTIPFHQRLINSGLIFDKITSSITDGDLIEGYDLKLTWLYRFKSGKTIKHIGRFWTSGTVHQFYTVLDRVALGNEMRSNYNEVINIIFDTNPKKILKQLSLMHEADIYMTLKLMAEGPKLTFFSDGNAENNVNLEGFEKDIEDLIRQFQDLYPAIAQKFADNNRLANRHVNSVIKSHKKSKDTLDDMFFN